MDVREIEYKFDVFYEFTIAGIPHKAAIECKYYDKRITEEMVRHFKSKLDECNNITGFVLATKSYNVDAKKYADRYGIKLITDDELPNIQKCCLHILNLLCQTKMFMVIHFGLLWQ